MTVPFFRSCSVSASVGLVVLLILTGCSSSRPASSSSPDAGVRDTGTEMSRSPAARGGDAQRERIEPRLRAEARSWNGVPHRWGGTDRNGVDCSGLTQALYADALGLSLPRDTRRQARVGERVKRNDLQPGDLVFFRPSRKYRHVGVYLSDGEFVHASSSSGVTISRLDAAYWRRTWWQARRVLPESEYANVSPSTPSPPTTDRPARGGW